VRVQQDAEIQPHMTCSVFSHTDSVGVPLFYITDTFGEDTEHHCKYGSNLHQCCEYDYPYYVMLKSLSVIDLTNRDVIKAVWSRSYNSLLKL
jgi:hypothetical protein